jgi:hypothetical protein
MVENKRRPEAGIYILVGAGSSVPFGFPDGTQLVDRFLESISSQLPQHVAKSVGDSFLTKLRERQPKSIDELLKLTHDQGHFSLLEYGRMFVEKEISKAQNAAVGEQPERLILPWLGKLLDGLGEGCATYDDFMEVVRPTDGRPGLSLNTLNYDLLLEFSIINYLNRRFPNRNTDISRDWDLAPQVNHLHGSINSGAYVCRAVSPRASKLSFWWEKSESPLNWSILNAVARCRDFFATIGFGFHRSVSNRFEASTRRPVLLCTDFNDSSNTEIERLRSQLDARQVVKTTKGNCSNSLVHELLVRCSTSYSG